MTTIGGGPPQPGTGEATVSTVVMALIVLKYFISDLPEYRISVTLLRKVEAKPNLAIAKVPLVMNTALLAGACLLFLLKCLGAVP